MVLHEKRPFLTDFVAGFQTCQVRNEDVEGKVFLLENMSAVPEDSSSRLGLQGEMVLKVKFLGFL